MPPIELTGKAEQVKKTSESLKAKLSEYAALKESTGGIETKQFQDMRTTLMNLFEQAQALEKIIAEEIAEARGKDTPIPPALTINLTKLRDLIDQSTKIIPEKTKPEPKPGILGKAVQGLAKPVASVAMKYEDKRGKGVNTETSGPVSREIERRREEQARANAPQEQARANAPQEQKTIMGGGQLNKILGSPKEEESEATQKSSQGPLKFIATGIKKDVVKTASKAAETVKNKFLGKTAPAEDLEQKASKAAAKNRAAEIANAVQSSSVSTGSPSTTRERSSSNQSTGSVGSHSGQKNPPPPPPRPSGETVKRTPPPVPKKPGGGSHH